MKTASKGKKALITKVTKETKKAIIKNRKPVHGAKIRLISAKVKEMYEATKELKWTSFIQMATLELKKQGKI